MAQMKRILTIGPKVKLTPVLARVLQELAEAYSPSLEVKSDGLGVYVNTYRHEV